MTDQLPAPEHLPPDDVPMPIMDHLIELRQRLLWSGMTFLVAVSLCYPFAGEIFDFLVRPLEEAMRQHGGTNRMIYTNLIEGFTTYLQVALFGGFVVAFPVLATQIWRFVAPGLYAHEKRAVLPFLIASPVLFILGAALVYWVILPIAWTFLLSFQTAPGQTMMPIQLEARVSEYLSLIMTMMVGFGICFQLPVLLALLARVGLLTADALVEKRRIAIVIIFVVAAVATPPDVVSQFCLAIPLMGLYEAAIYVCRRMEKRAKAEGSDYKISN